MTDPSPQEIRQECRRIQETWSKAEEHRRAAWAYQGRQVELREASSRDWPEASEGKPR